MTHVRSTPGSQASIRQPDLRMSWEAREPVIVVVQSANESGGILDAVCECLCIRVIRISSHDDLAATLRRRRPMAVVAEKVTEGVVGCHVLVAVAEYDRQLPVLMITGGDPALLGAIDAIEEVWQVGAVVQSPRLPAAGEIVRFLFNAGRSGDCLRLMPV